MIPTYLTHYYHDEPFQCITDLPTSELVRLVLRIRITRTLPRRLMKPVYFLERRRYKRQMREQFVSKGGRPRRHTPQYMVLGHSDIWKRQAPRSLRIPLAEVPSDLISFTYTDSWYTYVDFDLNRRPVPRKRPYEMVYRVEELDNLLDEFGWPGEQKHSDPSCRFDYYIEAQVWEDEPLAPFKQRFSSASETCVGPHITR